RDWSADVCSSDLSPPRGASCLVPIVVVAGQPEDWNHGPLPASLELCSEGASPERLVHHIHRATEKAWLLAGGHRERVGKLEATRGAALERAVERRDIDKR